KLLSTPFLGFIPHNPTPTHCVLPCSTVFIRLNFNLARVLLVSLQSRSTFCYIHRIAYTDIPLTHTFLIQSILSRILPLSPFSTHRSYRNRLYQNFAPLVSSVYCSVGCSCFQTTQHRWTYHRVERVAERPLSPTKIFLMTFTRRIVGIQTSFLPS